jgi:hypothetical protein
MDAGGEPLKRCSGFWIDFDEGSKTGTVLTTAHLIHTNDPPDTSSDVWIDEAHYDSKANVSRCVYELSVYILVFFSMDITSLLAEIGAA